MTDLATATASRGLLIGGKDVPAAGPEDVTRAVDAAHAAFPGWAGTAPSVRRGLLHGSPPRASPSNAS